MSVVIRLSRTGKTHNISFRIAVNEKWSKRDGKNVEELGFYNPFQREGDRYKINKERYDYWVSKGAKPSPAVQELVEGNGIRPEKPKKKKKEEEKKPAAQASPIASPAAQDQPTTPEVVPTTEVAQEVAQKVAETTPAEEVKAETPPAPEEKPAEPEEKAA
ncbi:30S ribosomal protein S16 [Candidatus Curtissbacteria bacterium]|nr:30S ribosomal protein S16 [Candidatus Curtissbacteria bacterium]